MKIIKITADEKNITLYSDGDGAVVVRESSPVVQGGLTYAMTDGEFRDGKLVLPRFSGEHDALYSRFTVYEGMNRADGQKYVSEICPESAVNDTPYPSHKSIKAINASAELQKTMFNVEQGRPDVSLPGLMTLQPEKNDIEFKREGKTYYFRAEPLKWLDEYMRAYGHSTFILLNS